MPAGLLNREKTLLHADLADATASGTRNRFTAFFRAAAVTLVTRDLCRHFDCYRTATDRFFKLETEFIAQVSTTKNLASSTSTTTKNIAEHIAENIAKTLGTEPATRLTGTQTFVPEAVIRCTIVLVTQYFVRFLGFLEACLGSSIVILVAIRVMLHGQAPIRLLDFGRSCALVDAQDLVVIAFCHGRLCH